MSQEQTCLFNVGGCLYSIPMSRLACFQESLLLKENVTNDNARLFLDRDGFTFRHLHYYIHTGKLASSCISELNILYELASTLRLTSLQQALENRQSGKHFLRARPVDLQVAERASMYYWKMRLCNPKQPEAVASPVLTVHDAIPLGLVGTPLVDHDEEVLYCFLPLDQIRLYPNLVTQDNLLWLCDGIAIIECGTRLFRFIANFLRTGKILLPEHFSDYELLSREATVIGMAEFAEALQDQCEMNSNPDIPQMSDVESVAQPLYVMTFDLLVKYPDSSLGQLHIDSNLEGSRLYITGSGVVFQHVQDWLGTCCLPLTEEASQLPALCEYLDAQDGAYQVFKEALFKCLHKRKNSTSTRPFTTKPWSASVAACTVYKIVKVYVGTYWYATYLQTLLKYPELLSNSSKVRWICFGHSLHVNGDGQIFRHILNFLRSGRLLLPADFREWPLLCQEIEDFQIPALSGALEDCSDYRAWCRGKDRRSEGSSSSLSLAASLTTDDEEDCFLGMSSAEDSTDFEVQETPLQESPDNSFLLLDDSSSRHFCPLAQSSYSPCLKPTSNTTVEQPPDRNNVPEPSTASIGHSVDPSSVSSDLSASIRSLLEKIRCTCLESLLQRLRNSIATSQHTLHGGDGGIGNTATTAAASSLRPELLSIPKERLLQILEESFKRKPSLNITRLPSVHSSSSRTIIQMSLSSGSSLMEAHDFSGAGDGCNWTGLGQSGGRVLSMGHPPVLGRGEPGGFFTHSIIYTCTYRHAASHPHLAVTPMEDPRDVAFAHFNLSYEEMVYGREGHAFLTGVILDSKMRDVPSSTRDLAHSIYLLWTGQTEAEEFVKDLLAIIEVKYAKNQEMLQQWLHFTLPMARRYTQCMMLLEKHCCQTETLFP
ncbi:BTB/POZ domain-containing protein KCTD19-like isoform X2 [Engraulis encrasicolus]|uniref:BTB/POZ domain-containing protein KCTD19-like isoform X2 n=1 Tax=Engraulis encrasicolus TaxID=184585 RepID=UPI002FD4A10C